MEIDKTLDKWFGKTFAMYQEKVHPPKKVDLFMEALKNKGPIGSKFNLWDLADEVGIRPRWKISPTIDRLKKEGKIYHQKTKPKGWKAK